MPSAKGWEDVRDLSKHPEPTRSRICVGTGSISNPTAGSDHFKTLCNIWSHLVTPSLDTGVPTEGVAKPETLDLRVICSGFRLVRPP